jgi:hypothetical protein
MVLTPVGIFDGGVYDFRYTFAGHTADDCSDSCACDRADGSSNSSHRSAGRSASGDCADPSSYEM